MNELERTDERLARLVGATRAEANPAVLARARARLLAEERMPRAIAWLGTPAALVTACALLVAAAGVSLQWARSERTGAGDTTLVSALIGDDGSYGLPAAATSQAAGTTDSGTVTP